MSKKAKPPSKPQRPGGWKPPAKGPARDRYTQEYIAGKLTQLTRILETKKG